MVRAGADLDKVLEAVKAAHHAIDAPIAGRQPGVAGMAGHADLALGGDRDDPLQEVGDATPVFLCGDRFVVARRIGVGLFEVPSAVDGAAATGGRACGALVFEGAEVVFDGWDAGFGRLSHHVDDQFDFFVALFVVAHHKVGHGLAVDVELGHGQGDHLHIDAEASALLLLGDQLFDVPTVFAVECDEVFVLVEDSVTGQIFEVFVRCSELLGADVHERLLGGVRGLGRNSTQAALVWQFFRLLRWVCS